ncbi:MAG: 3-hydroxylacyl-ACP dehydratase [Rhodospirillaceae bacterium]|nr:3-hydroxylacyl-ACP dehydratase [Rhodospirillaceae bacterium]
MLPCEHPIAALLPHAHPMILLDKVTGWGAQAIETTLVVRADAPFFQPGKGIAAHIAIEWMAQSCGAFVGLEALTLARPVRVGFLLGTRNFAADQAWFKEGETVHIRAELAFRDGETGVFDCTVRCRDAVAARAQLTLHQPADLAAVLASQGIKPGTTDNR